MSCPPVAIPLHDLCATPLKPAARTPSYHKFSSHAGSARAHHQYTVLLQQYQPDHNSDNEHSQRSGYPRMTDPLCHRAPVLRRQLPLSTREQTDSRPGDNLLARQSECQIRGWQHMKNLKLVRDKFQQKI
eukprot:GHVR01152170.1.p1 GENE.GHVR01152170.1~~GHVR01152170.1.p1  ORF type:complete len:130 (-),score=1.23 GHVR01152170.1:491-880(-)